ncbi:MAG TPA: diguanylate cyclase [Terriglobales bacterium]
MTIRKKIILFSALALGCFLAAVYLLSRFALNRGFARLESQSAQQTVQHLRNAFDNEQNNLEMMARDYAQWDSTYDFIQSDGADYVRSTVTDDTLKVLRVNLIAIFNRNGNLVLFKSVGNSSVGGDDLQMLQNADNEYLHQGHPIRLNGVVRLQGRLLMLSCQPVLSARGTGQSRGTLIMGRALDQDVIASLSRSAGVPVWIEPISNLAAADPKNLSWSNGTDSARVENDSTMLNYIALQDLSGRPSVLLAARTPRSLHLEAKTESRYLFGLLMLAGVVYCGILFFFVEEVLVARIARLSDDIEKVTLSSDFSRRVNALGRDEVSALARTLNSMLAAIQKARSELLQAQESLRFHAEHDALTGVLNRRAIRDVLRKELARCRRERNTVGLILVDVDHFKKINDHRGHAAGDAVLVTVVQRITSMLRPYDSLGRYGGEEFLIITPGCDLAVAQRLAERIRTAIADEPVDLGDNTAVVTVSMGVTLGTAESDPEFLVAQADTAMYNAKRNGRNRVEIGLHLSVEEVTEVEAR